MSRKFWISSFLALASLIAIVACSNSDESASAAGQQPGFFDDVIKLAKDIPEGVYLERLPSGGCIIYWREDRYEGYSGGLGVAMLELSSKEDCDFQANKAG